MMFYRLQPHACKPLNSIQIHRYWVWVWLNSDLCILGVIQLLLFIVELQGNEEGREKDKIEWDKPDKVIGSAFVSLCCGIHHLSFSASTFVQLISIHGPLCLLFDLFYTKAVCFCHFSPPSSSSLCSPHCVSTLQLNTQHSVHQKREDAAFSGCRGFRVAQTHVFAAHVQPKVAGFGLLKRAPCCRSATHRWLPASVERHVCLNASSRGKTSSDVVYRSDIIYISRICDVLEMLVLERGKQTKHAAVNSQFMWA